MSIIGTGGGAIQPLSSQADTRILPFRSYHAVSATKDGRHFKFQGMLNWWCLRRAWNCPPRFLQGPYTTQ